MKLLLDTHTLLWFIADAPKLTAAAKAALVDPDNERLLTPISLVPIEAHHVEPLTTLPLHHKDPFDRLIAAIVLVEKLTLVFGE